MKTIAIAAAFSFLLDAAGAAATPAAGELSYQEAKTVSDGAAAVIAAHHLGGAVAVVDAAGNLVAFERLDGASLANGVLAPKKAYSAAAFATPTETFQRQLAQGDTSILGNPIALPLGGGVPIMARGKLLGAVGVSTPDGAIDIPAAEAGVSALHD